MKEPVTYSYCSVSLCSDGCCTENQSTVLVGDVEFDVGTTMFDRVDLCEWMTAQFSPEWEEYYYVDDANCLFY